MTHDRRPDDRTAASDTGRNRRPDKTYRKHVVLTDAGREQIAAWAEANGLNFSAAIETLALIGLGNNARSDYILPALREVTRQALAAALNRLTRLLYDIALEAAAGRTLAEGILLQQIRQTAEQHPDNFEDVMYIRYGDDSPRDARLRRLHDSVKQAIAREAATRLRRERRHASALDYLWVNADEDDEAAS